MPVCCRDGTISPVVLIAASPIWAYWCIVLFFTSILQKDWFWGRSLASGRYMPKEDRLSSMLCIQVVRDCPWSSSFLWWSREQLTPVLHELHWLSVRQRIEYKLAMTVYQCLNGLAPTYLADDCLAISAIAGRRHLRSACTGLLSVLRTTTTLGMRSFVVASPVIWNSLPATLRAAILFPALFAQHLKAHLFGWSAARLRSIYDTLYKSTQSSSSLTLLAAASEDYCMVYVAVMVLTVLWRNTTFRKCHYWELCVSQLAFRSCCESMR